jgi:RNA polymerase sigma factor (sigma-70 family)
MLRLYLYPGMLHVSHSKKDTDFKTLYLSTRDGVFHFLHRYTRDIPLIEDIMQQCYLRIWERMDVLDDPLNAGPLVRTYARNLLIDVIRKRMREDALWLEQLQQEAERIVDTSLNEAGKNQLLQLDRAIDALPVTVRTVYLLHRDDGLSYKDISSRLSISVSTVEKHMSKAIRLLKKEMLSDMSLVLTIVASSEWLKG